VKLYGYWRSSSAWRVRIALAYKNLPYEYQAVNLLAGEQNAEPYRRQNPSGTVPMLQIEEHGKVHQLVQSVAIIELLEERHPTPALLPEEPFARARVRGFVEYINSGIQPLQNTAVTRYVGDQLHADVPAWSRHWIEKGLAVLEEWVAVQKSTFALSRTPSMADVFLVPQLYASRRFGADVSKFPNLLRVEAACQALPAFAAAHADRQPDAVKS
jgi:maleylpyruvate isomerase